MKNIDIDIDNDNLEDIDIDMALLENIDIDKEIHEYTNIYIDIDKDYLGNIDICIDIDIKDILENINIDKGFYKIFWVKKLTFQQI